MERARTPPHSFHGTSSNMPTLLNTRVAKKKKSIFFVILSKILVNYIQEHIVTICKLVSFFPEIQGCIAIYKLVWTEIT